MNLWTPIIILAASNVIYNLCSKCTPSSITPMAMLVVVYIIGAITAAVMYYTTSNGPGLQEEFKHLNWAGILMGLSVVGLEIGNIYMYKVGWELSVGFLLSSIIVALALLAIGVIFYHDEITVTKLAGIVVCLVGLYLINK